MKVSCKEFQCAGRGNGILGDSLESPELSLNIQCEVPLIDIVSIALTVKELLTVLPLIGK